MIFRYLHSFKNYLNTDYLNNSFSLVGKNKKKFRECYKSKEIGSGPKMVIEGTKLTS